MVNIMHRFQYIILLGIVGVVCMTMQFNHKVNGCDGIMIYSFEFDVFQDFIENPAKSIVEDKERIEETIIKQEEVSKEIVNIGSLIVDQSLIEFVGNLDEVEKKLEDLNLKSNVDSAVIVNIPQMPITIWARSNENDFFITIDEQYQDSIREDKSKYVYRAYTYQDYYNKFGNKDGRLFVNERDITDGNLVKLNYSGAFLPVRAVLEHLGAEVEWNSLSRNIIIRFNEEEYILIPDNLLLTEKGMSSNLLLTPPGGSYYYCKIIGNRTIMNNDAMQVLVRLLGASIDVDYDNLTIKINR